MMTNTLTLIIFHKCILSTKIFGKYGVYINNHTHCPLSLRSMPLPILYIEGADLDILKGEGDAASD